MTPRVVFDCVVFLQGAGRRLSPARECFRLIEDGKATLYVSQEILNEAQEVLNRPQLRKKLPQLTPKTVEEVMQIAALKAVLVDEVPKVYSFERDPRDEPYLNLAIAAKASYLVSRDKDLLDLMSDAKFRDLYPDLTILDPIAFLHTIEPKGGASS